MAEISTTTFHNMESFLRMRYVSCVCACVHVCVHACMCECVCMCVCMCVVPCVWLFVGHNFDFVLAEVLLYVGTMLIVVRFYGDRRMMK